MDKPIIESCGKFYHLDSIRNERGETFRIAPIFEKMRENHLKWFEHVYRRQKTAPVRKIERMYLQGTRERGRPLKIWLEGVK